MALPKTPEEILQLATSQKDRHEQQVKKLAKIIEIYQKYYPDIPPNCDLSALDQSDQKKTHRRSLARAEALQKTRELVLEGCTTQEIAIRIKRSISSVNNFRKELNMQCEKGGARNTRRGKHKNFGKILQIPREPIRTYTDVEGHLVQVYAPAYAIGTCPERNYGGQGDGIFGN